MISGSRFKDTVFGFFSGRPSCSNSKIRCLRSGDPDRRTGDARADCNGTVVRAGAGWSRSAGDSVFNGLRRALRGSLNRAESRASVGARFDFPKFNFEGEVKTGVCSLRPVVLSIFGQQQGIAAGYVQEH